MASSLIPSLPDDLALHCLLRVPRICHSSLRSVCSAWKQLLDNPFFFSRRRHLGLTEQSLFLLPSFPDNPNTLQCVEIDLQSKRRRRVVFNHAAISDSFFLEGPAFISSGGLVIILGGYPMPSPPGGASASMTIFDSLTRKCTFGASMGMPRAEFAWGVINGRLYVAGGFGAENVGLMVEAEAYDFETDTWSRISSMPFAMATDLFFVLEGRLFVRGWIEASGSIKFLSYRPNTDEWKEEPKMLDVFKEVPPHTQNKVATTSRDETIFMAEMEEPGVYIQQEREKLSSYMKITKYDSRTLQWTMVWSKLDEFIHLHYSPPIEREVPCHVLKDKVLVLVHSEARDVELSPSEEAEDIELHERDQVLEVSVLCPSMWFAAILNV